MWHTVGIGWHGITITRNTAMVQVLLCSSINSKGWYLKVAFNCPCNYPIYQWSYSMWTLLLIAVAWECTMQKFSDRCVIWFNRSPSVLCLLKIGTFPDSLIIQQDSLRINVLFISGRVELKIVYLECKILYYDPEFTGACFEYMKV